MSKQVIQNYSFNSANKTITLTDFTGSQPVHLERLALITDTTTNQILYNFADSTISTASVSSNNVITLSTLPSGVAGSDTLRIDYNTLAGDPQYDTPGLATNAAKETGGNLATLVTNTTGLATAAKQPALGTAGTPAADVLSVQGIASMTALKVDGSGVTQPVSGTVTSKLQDGSGNSLTSTSNALDVNIKSGSATTVTANIGTTNGLALDATLTGGTQQTKLTDGTNIANILKSDGTAAGQNSQLVARTHLTVPFTTTTAQAVGTTDAANYSSVSVHTTSQGTGSTVSFQGSNDNTNWASVSLLLASAVGTSPAGTSTNATTIYSGPLNFRYFRLNVTGISAGTTAGTIEFLTSSYASPTSAISVGSNNGTGSAVPATAFYIAAKDNSGNLQGLNTVQANNFDSTTGGNLLAVGGMFNFNGSGYDRQRTATAAAATTGTGLLGAGVLGIYNSSPPTITSGNYERLQLDSSGNLKVNLASGSGGSTQITDGTNTANVLKSDGTAAGQNSQMVGPAYQTQTFSFSSVTAGTTYDVGNYNSVSVQVTTLYTGTTPTLSYQASNDGTNWFSVSLISSGQGAGSAPVTSSTTTGILTGSLRARYFRLNQTGTYSSGSTTGVIIFSTALTTTLSNQANTSIVAALPAGTNTIGNVGASSATGSAVPSNAFYIAGNSTTSSNLTGATLTTPTADGVTAPPSLNVNSHNRIYNGTTYDLERSASSAAATTGTGLLGAGVLGIYNSSPPTITSGNYERLQLDSSGNLKVNIASGSGGSTQITDGTTISSNLAGDTGQNAQLVAGSRKEVSFTTTTAQAVASTDVSNYRWVSVQINTQGTGSTVTFQGSNDNVNWITIGLINAGGLATSAVSSSTGTAIYHGPLSFRYFRLNVTGISAGTTAGVIEYFSVPSAMNSLGIAAAQSGAWAVSSNSATGSAVPANGFYLAANGTSGNLTGLNTAGGAGATGASTNAVLAMGPYVYNGTNFDRQLSASTAAATTGTGLLGAGVLGIYNSSPPTITSGNYERLQLDSSGNLKVNIASGSGGSTQITDGTNSANILKSDGTAAGQNAQLIGNAYQTQTFSVTSVTAGTAYDAGGYRWVSVQITSQYTGTTPTITFQASNDGTNWFSIGLAATATTSGLAVVLSSTTTGIWHGPLPARYFRLNFTGTYSSGSATGQILFSTLAATLTGNGVAATQQGTWTVGSNSATGSTTPANAFMAGMSDGTNLQAAKAISATTDAQGGGNNLAVASGIYNGTNYDRVRSIGAGITAGTGVAAAGSVGLGKTTNPTAVTDGQYVAHLTDKLGKQVVVGSIRDLKVQQQTTITSSTSETTVLTAVASTFLDVYGLIVANTSATACEVLFKDATAGTTRFSIYVPAGDTRGFMLPESAAHSQSAVNNNWTATCGTSVASIKVTVLAVKNI